jgi:corrinoid protein of di/trimethylamine methyltransferase
LSEPSSQKLEKRLSSDTSVERLKKSVISGQEQDAENAAREIVQSGIDPMLVMETELFPTIKSVGEEFERGEYFLTDLMSAADAMRSASRILAGAIKAESKVKTMSAGPGKVVIGTVAGDIHDIGKNIVALLLEVNGFVTIDLGKDVDSMKFIERATEVQANIMALSALMTTTKPAQREVTDLLSEMNLRKKFLLMIGGAPTTSEWAEQIGADGWAETAEQGVKLAQKLIKTRVIS